MSRLLSFYPQPRGRPRKPGVRRDSGGMKSRGLPVGRNAVWDNLFGYENCAVYVMADSTGLSKIGRSYDPQQRRIDVQNGNGRTVRLVWTVRMAGTDAIRVESIIHRTLRSSKVRARGEWYRLSALSAVAVVLRVMDRLRVMGITEVDDRETEPDPLPYRDKVDCGGKICDG